VPYTTNVAGTTITAAWANANIRDQVVTPFATEAARTSAVTAPVEGMLSYLADSDRYDGYSGAAWLNGLPLGAWTDYSATFAITAVTTNPTKGNSTYAAEWVQIGKTVFFAFAVTIGSTYSAGSGAYRFSIPVAASTAAQSRCAGVVFIQDSGSGFYCDVARGLNSTNIEIFQQGIGTALGSAGPGTAWATNDQIFALLCYQA
jgi:hypothetical protein